MRKRSNPNDTGLNQATSKGDSIQKDKIINPRKLPNKTIHGSSIKSF